MSCTLNRNAGLEVGAVEGEDDDEDEVRDAGEGVGDGGRVVKTNVYIPFTLVNAYDVRVVTAIEVKLAFFASRTSTLHVEPKEVDTERTLSLLAAPNLPEGLNDTARQFT